MFFLAFGRVFNFHSFIMQNPSFVHPGYFASISYAAKIVFPSHTNNLVCAADLLVHSCPAEFVWFSCASKSYVTSCAAEPVFSSHKCEFGFNSRAAAGHVVLLLCTVEIRVIYTGGIDLIPCAAKGVVIAGADPVILSCSAEFDCITREVEFGSFLGPSEVAAISLTVVRSLPRSSTWLRAPPRGI